MVSYNFKILIINKNIEKNLPKRQAHILLGLEREISEEEDDENTSNIEGDQSMGTSKKS